MILDMNNSVVAGGDLIAPNVTYALPSSLAPVVEDVFETCGTGAALVVTLGGGTTLTHECGAIFNPGTGPN